MYSIHPSKELTSLYRQKPYQGQNPELAKVIFLGLDANFAEDIEQSEYYPYIKEYLTDGVKFWEKYDVHHPFMLPQYKNRDGVTYHKNFSKLKLCALNAKHISFVELLDVPTVGRTSNNKRLFYGMLNRSYLIELEALIFTSDYKKLVFIPRGVYKDLLKTKKEYDIFHWLPDDVSVKDLNKAYKIVDNDSVCIYVVTHFSDTISNEHINEIRQILDTYLPNSFAD